MTTLAWSNGGECLAFSPPNDDGDYDEPSVKYPIKRQRGRCSCS